MSFRKFLVFAILSVFLLNSCNSQKAELDIANTQQNETVKAQQASPESKSQNQHREWYTFEAGIRAAEAEKKHLIIDFYTDWCKWCKVMDEKTFSQPDVEAFLFERFIPIRLDAESNELVNFKGKNYSYRELTGAFGVSGFPSLAYLTPKIELITIIPGYIEKAMFLDILTYMSQECYTKNIPFDQFKSSPDCVSQVKTES
ncbi:MAG TPA: thioredoxin family protein [Candidatus Marinimicrobia bacterium]|nr:thioredoxin family protein [Candidatus Neomarinimicrobiota bacterium]